MTPKAREALDAYYAEAGSWGRDVAAEVARSRRIAWIVAGVASAIALAEALALVALTPLKTVEPYTLLVDRNTGFVQALAPLDPAKVAPDTALTQSFLVQYVIARESFDIAALQSNYRRVVQWSEGTARARYIAGVQASNPDSPLASLPRSSVVETRVKSVSPLGPDAALVRFDTQRRDAGGQAGPLRAFVAVIRYRYSGEPLKLEDRFVNPLGFEVSRYQRNAEALPPPEVQGTAATTAAAPSPLQAVVTPVATPTPGVTVRVTGGTVR
ncbi:VirB8/TrbF family protein [Sphingomonas donggukensis]|uniref:VirB8/TrbF family protein n=1 Tax=Sphingomonas donggukensis TaxID=2949093 RepID=A0ABY4TSV4_9SPHN|nr:VirB8/TrbF family protein [Sphingomonas donggukensis]URW74905.1 VirB8/TrbF family protein [Sphingomonas donggukensis]